MPGTDNAQVEAITATMTALSTIFVRRCLGTAKLADVEAVRDLNRHLVEVGAPIEIIAVATAGGYASDRGRGEIDEDVLSEIVEVTRAIAGTYDDEGLTVLAASALVLVVRRGWSDRPGHDLVLAAQALWHSEHHDLAVAACREALSTPQLDQLDEATALMLLARITNDQADVERVRAASAEWSAEVAAKVDIRSLMVKGELRDDNDSWDLARDAMLAGDRQKAAGHLAEAMTYLMGQSSRDRRFLEGLHRGALAMAGPAVDVENLRVGLVEVVRQVRSRQRFGNVPPTARSGLELLILILLSDDNEAKGSVLAELLEALADAGLSEVGLPASERLPQVAEADLAEKARYFPLWPDLRVCVDGLRGNFCLLARRVGGGRTTAERWITMFVAPPGGVLIRSAPLAADHAAVLDRLNPGSGPAGELTQQELDELARAFLHVKAVDMLVAQPGRGLVVVPDGPLWSVPWQAATLFRSRATTIAPSMTLYATLGEPPARVRSVVALLGEDLEGAEWVKQELLLAQEKGLLDVTFDESALDQECDLLLVLAHGTGNGLSFRIGLGAGLTAHELAQRSRARSALIACCGSAKTPPVALPINLPASLLMQGRSQCVGGIWLVPQAATSRLVASVVTHLATGHGLDDALALARAGSTDLMDDWGLVTAGAVPQWVEKV